MDPCIYWHYRHFERARLSIFTLFYISFHVLPFPLLEILDANTRYTLPVSSSLYYFIFPRHLESINTARLYFLLFSLYQLSLPGESTGERHAIRQQQLPAVTAGRA